MTNSNSPWSFASPWGSGMMEAEVVSINSPDNSVQVRIHGYQDDTGLIPDAGLQWVKVLGSSAGIMGATSTHNLYPGAKVMLGASGQQLFVMGSVTGYDSDSSKGKQGADDSDNTDPNTPRQVRGPQGAYNRTIPAGEGSDQTSKGTRNVTKTNEQFDKETPEKVYEYAKGTAPFTFGKPAKFPDLMSIGIQKLVQGSNVLDTIDQMDGNVSGAIQASTKIIRSMQQGGFGDALSLMGGGASEGTQQVAQDFGNIPLQELLRALLALFSAYQAVQASTALTGSDSLSSVPGSLQYQTFRVDQATQDAVSLDVSQMDSTGSAKAQVLVNLRVNFQAGFNQAVSNAIAFIAQTVGQYGIAAIVTGLNGVPDQIQQFVGVMQSVASAAGVGTGLTSIGNGVLNQVLSAGAPAIQSLIQSAASQVSQLQKVMQDMNTFGSEINAMKEIMGGGASIDETLTGITMKFAKKLPNLDAKGFTK